MNTTCARSALVGFVLFNGSAFFANSVFADDVYREGFAKVSIAKEGEGVVKPFEGSEYVSHYKELLPDCQSECELHGAGQVTDCGECEDNVLEVKAIPAVGWYFSHWSWQPFEKKPHMNLEVSGEIEIDVEAVFMPLDDLDTIEIAKALSSMKMESADVNAWDFEGLERVITGNGIPDRLEFLLIERILRDRSYDYEMAGGAVNSRVRDAWRANAAIAEVSVGELEAQYPRITIVVAAYLTLGDDGSMRAAMTIVEDYGGTPLEMKHANLGQGDYLGSEGDADGDGILNIEEYTIAMRTARFMTSLDADKAYLRAWSTPATDEERKAYLEESWGKQNE
jgi:hypothetical protein